MKAHQDGTNISSHAEQAIGKSLGGKSTKIHLAFDSGGLPIHFELSGGQAHDVSYGESLIVSLPEVEVVVADKGYYDIDWAMYRYRHLVENAFLNIKKHRAVATRYDKLARNYQSVVALAFSFMWLPMWVDWNMYSKVQHALI